NQNRQSVVELNWKTCRSESDIITHEEGLYWVKVNNENGCTGTDTVTVQFAGIAPEVQYTASQFCAGTEIIFTDETDPGDDSQVVSTIWIFGNDTLQGETVSYSFIEHGNYPLQLRVLTDVGCTGVLTDVIEIHPLPEVAFGH